MDVLHRVCLIIAGVCLVIITLIIPWGVFTRYVLNSASSWPEPMAVLLMIWFSFLAAAFCYREHLHIGVGVIPMMLTGKARIALGWLIEICMLGTNLFMLGTASSSSSHLVSRISRFPDLSRSASPICRSRSAALITALFVIERIWTREFFVEPDGSRKSATISTE